MTYKMGWLDRVTKINFPDQQGIAVLTLQWHTSSEGAPVEYDATIDGLPRGGSTSFMHPSPALGGFAIDKQKLALPFWGAPAVTKHSKTTFTPVPRWVIDTATWSGFVNGHGNGQVAAGPKEATRRLMAQGWYDFYGALSGITPPDFPEFTVEYVDNVDRPLPGPPDPSFFADPRNSAHQVQDPPVTMFVEAGFGLLFVNLKEQKKGDSQGATELHFSASLPSNAKLTSLNISAQGFKSLKTFPYNTLNTPTNWDPTFVGGPAPGTFHFTVDYKTGVLSGSGGGSVPPPS